MYSPDHRLARDNTSTIPRVLNPVHPFFSRPILPDLVHAIHEYVYIPPSPSHWPYHTHTPCPPPLPLPLPPPPLKVDVALAADVGGLQRFPKIVGNDSLVRELALSSRRFGSDEALSMGLVSRVCTDRVALMEQGLELCSLISRKSPVATLGVKTFL